MGLLYRIGEITSGLLIWSGRLTKFALSQVVTPTPTQVMDGLQLFLDPVRDAQHAVHNLAKVDGFVPRTHHVNKKIVRQPDRSSMSCVGLRFITWLKENLVRRPNSLSKPLVIPPIRSL